jgi:hypothetical protein
LRPLRKILSILCIFFAGAAFAQNSSNLRETVLAATSDTIKLDSLSLIKGSEILYLSNGEIADSRFYHIDYVNSLLYLKEPITDTIKIVYRVFPYNFSRVMSNKNYEMLEPDETGKVNPFSIVYDKNNDDDIFKLEGLNKNGSISRGVTFGNNQDLAVNSNMNLQLSGKINENVSILAAITDNNIPIQPDGNTHQLQDFDQVYIQLFDERSKLTAGDFQL